MVYISELNEFCLDIISIANKVNFFPTNIDQLMYDPRYNDEYVIELLKKTSSDKHDYIDDIDSYYRIPLGILSNKTTCVNKLTYVGDSEDFKDDLECGDFNYYTGFINSECPFIFHESSHIFAWPNRLVIYSPNYQIEVSSYKKDIEVYETVKNIRNIFFINDISDRIKSIKELLKSTDRPRLIF